MYMHLILTRQVSDIIISYDTFILQMRTTPYRITIGLFFFVCRANSFMSIQSSACHKCSMFTPQNIHPVDHGDHIYEPLPPPRIAQDKIIEGDVNVFVATSGTEGGNQRTHHFIQTAVNQKWVYMRNQVFTCNLLCSSLVGCHLFYCVHDIHFVKRQYCTVGHEWLTFFVNLDILALLF